MAEADQVKEMEEAVKKVEGNPKYKILTKEEYDILMGGTALRASTPKQPIPTHGPRFSLQPRTPGALNTSRLRQILTPHNASQSFMAAPTYNPPKLPFFSGSAEPNKGEASYEVWQYEVKCLQKADGLPESVLLHSIRSSLRGAAREHLIPMGEDASVDEILHKLNDFYGNVSTAETIIQSFYNDFQKEDGSVASFGSRLEQTLSRAIRYGHMELAAKDSMLRSKFWTGLKSQQLRNSTRYLYDTYKDFPSLLREIRKVEQEDSCSQRLIQPTGTSSRQKVAQQHASQVEVPTPTDQSDKFVEMSKQMSDLMKIVKSLDDKMEAHEKTCSLANSQPVAQQDYDSRDSQNYGGHNQRGKGRGYGRGQPWRGKSGNTDNYHNNRGGFRGGYSRGRGRGGPNRGGTGRGSGSKQSDRSEN